MNAGRGQAVSRGLHARFLCVDENRRLVYRGQMDDSRPGNDVPITGADLRAALDAVLEANGSGKTETEYGLQHQMEARP